MNYKDEYGLSKDDLDFLDENIQKANAIFREIETRPDLITDLCDNSAITEYLNEL